MNGKTLGI